MLGEIKSVHPGEIIGIRTLERLLASGFVVRENYSFGSVNRTYWYGLGERAKPFGPKGPNHNCWKNH
jgi:hypothetical protein